MIELCILTGCFSGRASNSLYCNVHHNQQHGVKPAMISDCSSGSCRNKATHGKMFCDLCSSRLHAETNRQTVISTNTKTMPDTANKTNEDDPNHRRSNDQRMSFKYPKYYKAIPTGVTEIDIYMLCHIFRVEDHSGALHHAIKKILLPGVRTGGKTRYDDIKEARDTLSRWLEIHKP